MRLFKAVLFTLIILMIPLASLGGSKQEQVKAPKDVMFEGKLSSQQQKVALKMAHALRSGNLERIRAFVKDNEAANQVLTFWAGHDELSKLKFRVRPLGSGFSLADAERGMSSCDVVKNSGRFIIENCTFNDGY